MNCPKCQGFDSAVSDSRPVATFNAIRRRRHCTACQHRWTTYEVIGDLEDILKQRNDALPGVAAGQLRAKVREFEVIIDRLEGGPR